MKNEFDVKEKDTAEFAAVLSGKAVYIDDEKKKYVLASKDEINKLVKDAYARNDYIKANELLESAKNIFGKDIKKELREIVSKSMRLKMNVFLALLNEAYDSDISVSDVIRKKISDRLKENLNGLNTTNENKSLLMESLNLWANKKPVMHKEEYSDSLLIHDILSSERIIELGFRDMAPINDELKNAIECYAKQIFERYLKSTGLSDEQSRYVMGFFDDIIVATDGNSDTVSYSLRKSDNKKADLQLVENIEIFYTFKNFAQMIEGFLHLDTIGWDEGEILNKFSKKFEIIDFDEKENTDIAQFTETLRLSVGISLNPSSKEDFIVHAVIPSLEFKFMSFYTNSDETLENKELQYIEIDGIPTLEKIVFEKLVHSTLTDEESLKKQREEYTSKGNYEKAQEINNLLLYIDSCRKFSKFLVRALMSYVSGSKVISITIPKGLLLWFNALGGDNSFPELIKK